MASRKKENDGVMLGIHLDIGYKSIGWTVSESGTPVLFRGCGTLLFQKDDCLASNRRTNRRQRRHIRSTRQRIEHMRKLLLHLGVMPEEALTETCCSWPWKLAAEVLTCGRKLTWPEMWDVLRWYAHNRGYDGNIAWQRGEETSQKDEDIKKGLTIANGLMEEHDTTSMAETFCAVLGIEPGKDRCASRERFKALDASFPRKTVESELRSILQAHIGELEGVNEKLITTLLGAPGREPDAWKTIPCPDLDLPKRYKGGLLLGQRVPRFDNRIIGTCPVSGNKLPHKKCPEFLEYRWAMQLANIRIQRSGERDLTPLNAEERKEVTARLRELGWFSKTTLKKAVKDASGAEESNIDDMLLHPDAERALLLYPALYESAHGDLKKVWEHIPEKTQSRILRKLGRGKTLTLGQIRDLLEETDLFDAALKKGAKKSKKAPADPLKRTIQATFPSGRAPYSREVMRKAVEEVMAGNEPRSEEGILYTTAEQPVLPEKNIDRKTNNHLVRHRLKMMRRLLDEIIEEYASGDKAMIECVTIEFNREVQEMSGKPSKEIAKELTFRLKSHKQAVAYASEKLDIPERKLGGSLIRKVRIAQDLDWTCPYTGEKYDIHQLMDGSVDLDHIIPRSDRKSDSLDSLVITFKSVNAWKSNTTAMEFIEENAGKPVPGMPKLSILSVERYTELVGKLNRKKMPHRSGPGERKTDDEKRRNNRCKRLLQKFSDKKSKSKGFTPGNLTVSSYLVTLAMGVARELFKGDHIPPKILTLPGRITKEVRMGYKLMGLLAEVNPDVLDADGEVRPKTEIREITNLHHAIDAVTLGLASNLIPMKGNIWELMVKRNLNDREKEILKKTGAFIFDSQGKAHLKELPGETVDSIRQCLAECRVATHIPATKGGAVLEQTTWSVTGHEEDIVALSQRTRDEKGNIQIKEDKKNKKLLLGIEPQGESKLEKIKGVIQISRNYALALDPEPEIIPWHKVWHRIGEIKKKNGGKMPRILRNGMLIQVSEGRYQGTWKIFSIKNNANGLCLALGKADDVNYKKANVLLNTLLKNGMETCPGSYTGVPRHVPPSD
jgi:hypothetical protein